ncbi:HBL/NHE enterotoxin family protein [Pseudomonas sp. NPDC089752]|uniref:HBL/NHE enterotoxin family protein n=1 Tax=Pseudomonas sp. NPDC089752 TaxID=3364472 RepID=UPI003817D3A8
MTLMQRFDSATLSAFSVPAIVHGTLAVSSLLTPLDQLSASISQMPELNYACVPGLAQHIIELKQLAAAWPTQYRPPLLAAMQQLQGFGDQFINRDAPALRQLFQAMNEGNAQARVQAVAQVAALEQQLAGPVFSLNAVTQGLGQYLAQLHSASADLNGDATQISQRLETDRNQSAVLAQQIAGLQSQLDAARNRAKWYWLMGPLAALLAREIDSLVSNISGVTDQLNRIRADQAANGQEAAYLQALLPALSNYLAAVDQMGAGVNATLAGTQALQSQLQQLQQAIDSSAVSGAFASAQLDAAIADWQEVQANIGRLS